MSEPIVLSDEEDSSPFQLFHCKKRRTEPDLNPNSNPNPNPNPTVLVLDDDPTPQKPRPTSTPIFVPETPMSDLAIVKCTKAPSDFQSRVSDSVHNFSGVNGLICLESDNEPESGRGKQKEKENESVTSGFGVVEDLDWRFSFVESTCPLGDDLAHMSEGNSSQPTLEDDIDQVLDYPEQENIMDQMGNITKPRRKTKVVTDNENTTKEATERKKLAKEERTRLMEEKKLKKLKEKLQKEALKAEAAEMKKIQKEKQKWEKGKFALKSIVAEIDSKVVELGSVGGNLLTRFAEKGLTYRITSNPIERSIVWTMTVPEHLSQLSPKETEIQYMLLVYEAEEFCNVVINESLLDHVLSVRSRYPSYTVCCLTNRLMAYIKKREQELYKNPTIHNSWRRPPVEEVLAKLTTNFYKVHSRQCADEAELAEHVVGLTCSLSSCQFRKKLTRLDVNANGSLVPKDCIDRTSIKKSPWLKALVAIPKVQPRFAIAIWKKYPTMKSLLSVYMDPNISVHEKEFLLKDLTTEGLLGDDRRLGEVCSKRVYRILMAQSGCIKTDDVEDGADFFRH
ncbi:crossover junction endonuclease EME1B isoform X1 [Pyrus x bretschneideri]|uniref:crossover junction endonuclease EME1B isoform X1 n=1 Tax=Pyrus x bretschneideri TaxID=225117 RepID=UPI00202E272F|nr:crossover junction endonuclease EME1B isoform X1 [Pyrus x bretschneideri]XP_048437847.1 crossover junction endonuclease EME1B isoform X1 [Pyrus x bretschneideri]